MYRQITIGFTQEEREALERMAEMDTRPLKHEVRALVRAEAVRRGLWPASDAGSPEAAPDSPDRAEADA